MFLESYESPTFLREMAKTWNSLKPLYEQLHAYVRFRLYKHYSCTVLEKDGPLPAHLLGDMWAQSWRGISHIATPVSYTHLTLPTIYSV